MQKRNLFLILAIVILFFLISLFIFFKKGNTEEEKAIVLDRTYINEDLGYKMGYLDGSTVEEVGGNAYFHSAIANKDLLAIFGDWSTYEQALLVRIKGEYLPVNAEESISYGIDSYIYYNNENLSVEDWYNTAALAEALVGGRIDNSDFVRLKNKITNKELNENDGEEFFDPWMPRGELIKVGKKDVLKIDGSGNYVYDGFQYYLLSFGDYIYVFRFGYGGLDNTREMWKVFDTRVKGMISSLELL
jgi:hypothetical protein